MLGVIKKFLRSESGAVTVDWVVLTAAVVALAGAAMLSISSASGGVGGALGAYLTNVEVDQ